MLAQYHGNLTTQSTFNQKYVFISGKPILIEECTIERGRNIQNNLLGEFN